MLGEIYRMLALTIGEPVKEFTYAFKNKDGRTVTEAKKFTPKSFAAEMLGGKAIGGSFIMVMTRAVSITRLTRGNTTAIHTTELTGNILTCRWKK